MFTPDPYCPVQVRDSKGSHSCQSHGREISRVSGAAGPCLSSPNLSLSSVPAALQLPGHGCLSAPALSAQTPVPRRDLKKYTTATDSTLSCLAF